jgi:exonuclease SbcD
MRILHTADWHLGDRLGRIDRTGDLRRAVERIAAYCEQERVEILLVAGDLFSELSRADGLRDSIDHLRTVFLPFLERGGSLVALTGNHDNEGFCHTLRLAMTLAAPSAIVPGGLLPTGRVYLATEPTFFQLADTGGNAVQFVLMPYPTPSRYLEGAAQAYASVEEKNRALQSAFAARLGRIQQESRFSWDVPTVLAAHIHLRGARLSTPFRISERESIVFELQDVPADWAYVALGHIHQPQCLMGLTHVRYSGSIERLDLGERSDDKGVVLLDIGPDGRRGEPVVLPLPATPIYDVEIQDPKRELPMLHDRYPDADRALVRYHLRYTAGSDNLEEVLRELDRIFPRWYDRDWQEAGALSPVLPGAGTNESPRSFQDTVLDYLNAELLDHPDRDALLQLADGLLAEERA